jgi:RNA 3'-terminal phosphate cyclase (ATP)
MSHRLDGSFGEGGGQILRNAAAFAGLLQKDVVVNNIRAGRKQPGLRAQHVASLRLVADICGGTLTGAEVKSTEIRYVPSAAPHARSSTSTDDAGSAAAAQMTFKGEIGTAGSICLLLQASLPCVLFSGRALTLDLRGGTNATLAPQYDYWEHVFLPSLTSGFGLDIGRVSAFVKRRGYFPKGGGQVVVTVDRASPTQKLRPMHRVDRGHVVSVFVRAFHAGSIPQPFAQEMADRARDYVQRHLASAGDADTTPQWRVEVASESRAVGTACGILLVATTSTGCVLGGSALGHPKQSAQETGHLAARELCSALDDGGCVDDWLQDQLILYMALADGASTLLTGSLTLHTRTAIWVAEELTGATFEVERVGSDSATHQRTEGAADAEGRIPGMHMIRCHGIGFDGVSL